MSITIISYNFNSENVNMTKRIYCLAKLIYENKPNIVFLQEITNNILKFIHKNEFLSKYYHISKKKIDNYFDNVTLVFKSFRIVSIKNIKFSKTNMNRYFEETIIKIQNNNYFLINSHLESYFKNYKIKLNQLEEIFKKYKNRENIVIGMDSNLNGIPEDVLLKKYCFSDSYLSFISSTKKKIKKYTFNYRTNKMVKGRFKSRLDRCYFGNSRWKILNYEIIGNDNFKKYGFEISDHFGILVEIKM